MYEQLKEYGMICMICSGDLEISYQFHERCINNKDLLKEYIKKNLIDFFIIQTQVNFQTNQSKNILSETEIKQEIENSHEEEMEKGVIGEFKIIKNAKL